MKKSKLLIPALSIASVGAIVTPMVTSCNKTLNNGLSLTLVKNGSLVKEYKYKYAPITFTKEFKALTETEKQSHFTSEATQAYYKAVANDPKIYCDDLLGAFTKLSYEEGSSKITNLTVEITNISINWKKINGDDVPMVSATFNFETEFKQENNQIDNESVSIRVSNMIPGFLKFTSGANPAIQLYNVENTKLANTAMKIANSQVDLNYKYIVNGAIDEEYQYAANTYENISLLVQLASQRNNYIFSIFMSGLMGKKAPIVSNYFAKAIEK